MRVRHDIDNIIKTKEYTSSSYGEWERRIYSRTHQTVFGDKCALIEYFNTRNHKIFAIAFEYGNPFFHIHYLIIDKNIIEEYKAYLNEKTPFLEWTHYVGLRPEWMSAISDGYNYVNNVTFYGLGNGYRYQYIDAVQWIQSRESFPIEMVCQIKDDIRKTHAIHLAKLNELTDKLIAQDAETVKHIKNEIRPGGFSDLASGYVISWIDTLREEGRLYEALVWCSVFYESLPLYEESLLKARDILVLLVSDLKNHATENDAEYTFPMGDDYSELEYKELLFKIAWKIAAHTKADSDKNLAIRLLYEISGQPNFEKDLELPAFKSPDLLIHQARVLKAMSAENTALKEKIAELEARQASPGHLGMFGTDEGESSTRSFRA